MQTKIISRRLTIEEAGKVFPTRGQMDLSDYEAIMEGLTPGDATEVQIGDLTTRALKRRLGSAARKVLGANLKYKIFDDRIVFQVKPPTKTRHVSRSFAPLTRRGRPPRSLQVADPVVTPNGSSHVVEEPIQSPPPPPTLVEVEPTATQARPRRARKAKVKA